jgi:hypothetical protein
VAPESASDSVDESSAAGFTLPVIWSGWETTPLQFANQFILQHNGPDVFLTVGSLAPPVLVGSQDEMRAQAEAMSHVPAQIIARLVLSVEGTQQLAGALNTHLKRMGLEPSVLEEQ